MQNTKNNTIKSQTLTLTKEIGTQWIIKDINPFRKVFERYFDEDLGHDVSKLTACGCMNYVLSILAGDNKVMDLELRMSDERVDLTGYVEFELVDPGHLAAKYYVNNCPGCPQLVAWVNASAKKIFKGYPAFAYIKKV